MTLSLLILLTVSQPLTLRWVWLTGHARLRTLTPAFGWLCAGGSTLALPLLWTPAQQLPVVAPRVAALATGHALLIAGQQLLQHRDAWVPLYGARA